MPTQGTEVAVMNNIQFDAFTRFLSPDGSRRSVLTSLASGLLAALPLAVGREDTAAKKKGKYKKTCKKKRCGACRTCKKGKCKPIADGSDCGGPCRECLDGACRAKTGTTCFTSGACLSTGDCGAMCRLAMDDCPAGCTCHTTAEGEVTCIKNAIPDTCDAVPQTCTSSRNCPQGQVCKATGCFPNPYRCIEVCQP
jgi:hypothetical protein